MWKASRTRTHLHMHHDRLWWSSISPPNLPSSPRIDGLIGILYARIPDRPFATSSTPFSPMAQPQQHHPLYRHFTLSTISTLLRNLICCLVIYFSLDTRSPAFSASTQPCTISTVRMNGADPTHLLLFHNAGTTNLVIVGYCSIFTGSVFPGSFTSRI